MHSSSALLDSLPQNAEPGSTSALALPQFSLLMFLVVSFSTSFRAGRAENADFEQTEKMVPLITCEIALCQHVCELVFGVNIFDLDFGIQVDSVK